MKTQDPAGDRPTGVRVRLRLWALVLLAAGHCLLATSCKPNKRYDLIEAELRTRDRQLEETRAALEQARNLNRAYAQQSQPASGAAPPPPPSAPVYVPVKQIALARGTGGVDEDGVPGDEGLMVVVVPQDEDGSAVKVPASVRVGAWEVTPAGLKNPIGDWTVPAEKLRPLWRSGFISTGYFVALPWQTYPSQERVRVAVRLTTLDGRAFEADKDITVRLVQTPRVGPDPGPVPGVAPGVVPGVAPLAPPMPAPPGREPLFPDPLPPGAEELPPPAGAPTRGARLGLPEKN
jgi:hypothetical protein